MFSCSLFIVLFTITSIISSTILKFHMGLVLFLDKIRSHGFIGGYPFFYFYCARMLKQNHGEQRPVCSANKQVHRKRRIITLQEVKWVTAGRMLYVLRASYYHWTVEAKSERRTVDIRHTLSQFGDWSGPSRPLSSACAQDIVV